MLYNFAMVLLNKNVLLASGSPRRSQLLKMLLDDFCVCSPDADEKTDILLPDQRVMALARCKAQAVDYNGIVISADTLVYLNGVYYPKPHTAEVAKKMLTQLSGKTHLVYSGVCIKQGGNFDCFSVCTQVMFFPLTPQQIDDYICKHKPLDKAGAYGIQDGVVVNKIIGSYSNVMGLPLEELSKRLTALGLPVKEYVCSDWN